MAYQIGERVQIRNRPFGSYRDLNGTVTEDRENGSYRVKPDYSLSNIFRENELVPEPWRSRRVIRSYSDDAIVLTQTERNFMASSAAYMAFDTDDADTAEYWQNCAVRDGIIYG